LSYTTGDVVSRVQQRVRDTGYSSSEIKGYINDVQNDVFNEYRLPFMETTHDYTLTIGDSDITHGSELPTDYVQALDLYITTSGQERVVEYKDVREIDDFHPDPDDTTANASTTPRYWYFYAQTIRVFPVPDQAYTATLRYYKKPTQLSADADIPDVPSEFEELLVVGAAYRVLQVKDNYDQAGILENKYNELLQKLVVKYSVHQVGRGTMIRTSRRRLGKTSF
jgi:hypothetical protein